MSAVGPGDGCDRALHKQAALPKHRSPMSEPPAPPRTRKPRGQGPLRRAEILAAAKTLFLQHGVEHATMRRIAAAVGVSSTALYVYFPDKTAILTGIAEGLFEELLVVHAKATDPAKLPLQRLRDGLQAYVDLAFARADEYRLTFGSNACNEIAAADQSFEKLVINVSELIDAGLFAPANPMVVSEAIWSCVHGVVMILLNQSDHIATDPALLVHTVLTAAIQGFRPPA